MIEEKNKGKLKPLNFIWKILTIETLVKNFARCTVKMNAKKMNWICWNASSENLRNGLMKKIKRKWKMLVSENTWTSLQLEFFLEKHWTFVFNLKDNKNFRNFLEKYWELSQIPEKHRIFVSENTWILRH